MRSRAARVGWLEGIRQKTFGGVALLPVLALSGLNLVDELEQAAYGLFGPDIAREFNISPATFGLAFMPSVVLGMVAPTLIGYATDRFSRVGIALLGGAVWCGFALATGIVPTFLLFVVVRTFTAIGRAVSQVTHTSLLSDYYPLDGRGAAFSLHQNANPLGIAIGFIAGGAIATAWGWRNAFLILPLPGLLFLLLIALRLREPERGKYERADVGTAMAAIETPPLRQAFRMLWSIDTWRRYAWVWLLLAVGFAMTTVYPFYFEAVFGVGLAGRGLILAATAALSVVSTFIGGVVAQRMLARGQTRRAGDLLGWSLIAAAGSICAAAAAPNLPFALAAVLITAPLLAFASVPVLLIFSACLPIRIRGQGFGAIGFFFAVGLLFLPIGLSYGDRYSFRVSLLLGAPAFLAAAAMAFAAARHIQSDIHRANRVSETEMQVARRKEAGDTIDLLEVVNLDVRYDTVQVLFGVDLRVAEGEMVALLGTNGSGKSTLLRAISGLVPIRGGIVLYDAQDVTGIDAESISAKGIVQVAGGKGVFPGLSVRRNLRLGMYQYRKDKPRCEAAFDEACELFPQLTARLETPAGALSGGEQQMLTLARAFMAKPRLLMIDELSLGLAPVAVASLLEVVERIHKSGVTVILVEQSVNIALDLADRAYFLEKGDVRFEGPAADLLERDDVVRSVFLAGAAR